MANSVRFLFSVLSGNTIRYILAAIPEMGDYDWKTHKHEGIDTI